MQAETYIGWEAGYDEAEMPGGRPTKRKRPSFGERMAQARLEAGLTQQQLAERLGVSQRVITHWERQPVALRPDQLTALADALTVSTDALLGRTAPKRRGTGPIGKGKRLFAAISNLPRHQQEKIFSFLEPYVAHAQHAHDHSLKTLNEATG